MFVSNAKKWRALLGLGSPTRQVAEHIGSLKEGGVDELLARIVRALRKFRN
jgi:hypothetical protein